MNSTAVNSWISLIGCVVTTGSVWISLYLFLRSQRERRIQDVLSRVIDLRLAAEHPERNPSALTRFLSAGALTLDQSELVECAARLEKASEPNPLRGHASVSQRDILKKAKETGVDLDDWPKRTAFLIREALADSTA